MFLQSEWASGLQNASVVTILRGRFQGGSLGYVWQLCLVVLPHFGDLAPVGPSDRQVGKHIMFLRSNWLSGLKHASLVALLRPNRGPTFIVQAQSSDLFKLGFERSNELGFERSHRNRTRKVPPTTSTSQPLRSIHFTRACIGAGHH